MAVATTAMKVIAEVCTESNLLNYVCDRWWASSHLAPPVIGYPVNGGGYSGGYYNNYEAKPASNTDQKVEARGLDVSVEV